MAAVALGIDAADPNGLTKYLLAAVSAETSVIILLFGILLRKNAVQDKKLSECENDRKLLSIQVLDQQREVTNVWKFLAESATAKLTGTIPPSPKHGA